MWKTEISAADNAKETQNMKKGKTVLSNIRKVCTVESALNTDALLPLFQPLETNQTTLMVLLSQLVSALQHQEHLK